MLKHSQDPAKEVRSKSMLMVDSARVNSNLNRSSLNSVFEFLFQSPQKVQRQLKQESIAVSLNLNEKSDHRGITSRALDLDCVYREFTSKDRAVGMREIEYSILEVS